MCVDCLEIKAVCCSVLQCVAVCRRVLETRCNALQRTATHCNALQRTATHCNALQHTASHCSVLENPHDYEIAGGPAAARSLDRVVSCLERIQIHRMYGDTYDLKWHAQIAHIHCVFCSIGYHTV